MCFQVLRTTIGGYKSSEFGLGVRGESPALDVHRYPPQCPPTKVSPRPTLKGGIILNALIAVVVRAGLALLVVPRSVAVGP